MVKIFYLLVLSFSLGFGASIQNDANLTQKIKSFIDEETYNQNKAFINIIFSPASNYYFKDHLDSVRIIQTLKENGLLKLFFETPQELNLSFKTNGSPLFFVKIMEDTLRDIGYYRYVTTESNLNSSEFVWNISLTAEYATDPLVLQNELRKNGCEVVDIRRNSPASWVYNIDMNNGYLNVPTLLGSNRLKLKRSLYPHWLDVSQVRKIEITSSFRNSWYPYIAYYDSSLHLLKVIKKDRKRTTITLHIPARAKYMKLSDMYTLKNVKDALVLNPSN